MNDTREGANGVGFCMKKDTKKKKDRCQEKLGQSLNRPVQRGAARDKERKEIASFSALER